MTGLAKTILKHEARFGAKIFGKSSKDVEFYCLSPKIWIWRQGPSAVFYQVNPGNIYKSNDGISFRLVGNKEVERLYKAAKIYQKLIETNVYGSLLSLR